ncbi:hypothetical protein IPJ70_00590 [Candidatus Campbellbacteria bacterium]|nr:MAG: hypothetical protein IPJ70_00590 [Candidatus Campbellbacteria bacterium]
MATQGVVSVVKNGVVVLKVVAGCDGYNAALLGNTIRGMGIIPDAENAYDLAFKLRFGEVECLVAMDQRTEVFRGHDEIDSTRYRATFSDPRFNPRWEQGTADFVEVVEF